MTLSMSAHVEVGVLISICRSKLVFISVKVLLDNHQAIGYQPFFFRIFYMRKVDQEISQQNELCF